jgi:hypothetical protein
VAPISDDTFIAINANVPKNSKFPKFPGNEGITPDRFVIEQTTRIIKNNSILDMLVIK